MPDETRYKGVASEMMDHFTLVYEKAVDQTYLSD